MMNTFETKPSFEFTASSRAKLAIATYARAFCGVLCALVGCTPVSADAHRMGGLWSSSAMPAEVLHRMVLPLFNFNTYLNTGEEHVLTAEGIPRIFMFPLDENGTCVHPRPAEFDDIPGWVKRAGFTRVVLMSHGWQNEPATAAELYRHWFSALDQHRRSHEPADNPLYIGLYWPSTWWPQSWDDYVNGRPAKPSAASAEAFINRTDLDLSDVEREQARELLRADTPQSHQKLIALLMERLPADADGIAADGTRTDYRQLLHGEGRTTLTSDPAAGGTHAAATRFLHAHSVGAIPTLNDAGSQSPFVGDIDDAIRLLSVRIMKARAGKVAAADGLQTLLATFQTAGLPIHLMGHSFGSKLWLEALHTAVQRTLSFAVASLAVVQPAVARWCLSTQLPGYIWGTTWRQDVSGLYQAVLSAVKSQMLMFYSNGDAALMLAYPAAFIGTVDEAETVRAAVRPAKEIDMSDAWGANFNAAALGAHGPDLEYTPGSQRASFNVVMTAPAPSHDLADARILGVKGTWDHAGIQLPPKGLPADNEGWVRAATALIVHSTIYTGNAWNTVHRRGSLPGEPAQ